MTKARYCQYAFVALCLSTALVVSVARAQTPDGGSDQAKPQGSESHLGRDDDSREEPVEEGSESHLGREEEQNQQGEEEESAAAGPAVPTTTESLPRSSREQVYAVSSVTTFAPRNWLTLTLQHDFAWLGSEDNACTGNSAALTCVDANEKQIDPALVTMSKGRFDGRLSSSTTRLLLGYERILSGGFALGARAGFVLLGAPDAPGSSGWWTLHLEGRASYFFGGAAYYRHTLRPFITLGGGFARLASSSPTTVGVGSSMSVSADAYRTAGPGFVFVGAGTQLAISRQHALRFELRAAVYGDDLGMSVSGGLGYDFGF